MTGSVFLAALGFQAGYNVTLVALGTILLGVAAGAVGAFMVLRRRSLVADAMAHATLPGVGLAFLVMAAAGGSGRALPGLLIGAALTAGLGLLAVLRLTERTRLTEDAAIGAVLSSFFGAGVVILTVIQGLTVGEPAGLESFLLGSTAGMLRADALTIAAGAALVGLALVLLRRPLTLVAFDAGHARALGYPTATIDLALTLLALAVTVLGLRVVGLVLIVALLILPAAAARFWTDSLPRMVGLAALIGGASGWIGTAISASAPDLPAGPVIVLVAVGGFVVSLLFAPARGALASALRMRRMRRGLQAGRGAA